MKIKLTSVYVDDQDKALRFYTDVLGFVKKADFSNGPFRGLTVVSPADSEGTELQFALHNSPAAATWQKASFEQGQTAANFYTGGVQADYERVKARCRVHRAAQSGDQGHHRRAQGRLRKSFAAVTAQALVTRAMHESVWHCAEAAPRAWCSRAKA